MARTTANLKGLIPLDPTPCFTLTVRSGPAQGTTIRLSQRRTTIGRSVSADLTIDEAHLSRYHVEIELLPGARGLVVRDLHSKNGTFVRNCRIMEALIDGPCTIEIGEGTLLEIARPPDRATASSWLAPEGPAIPVPVG